MLPPPEQMPQTQPVILGLVPMYHAYGLIGILCMSLAGGVKIISMAKFQPRKFLAAIEKYKVSIQNTRWENIEHRKSKESKK